MISFGLPLPPGLPAAPLGLPAGSVAAFAGEIGAIGAPPAPYVIDIERWGWMVCDGRQLLVTMYPELFAVLGFRYVLQGESTTLPDDPQQAKRVSPTKFNFIHVTVARVIFLAGQRLIIPAEAGKHIAGIYNMAGKDTFVKEPQQPVISFKIMGIKTEGGRFLENIMGEQAKSVLGLERDDGFQRRIINFVGIEIVLFRLREALRLLKIIAVEADAHNSRSCGQVVNLCPEIIDLLLMEIQFRGNLFIRELPFEAGGIAALAIKSPSAFAEAQEPLQGVGVFQGNAALIVLFLVNKIFRDQGNSDILLAVGIR